MDRREQVLALFLDELGIDQSDLSTFEGRKRFQKTIYLLQQPPFTRDFGFHYNLYIKGPYSPALADAGYGLLSSSAAWSRTREELELRPRCRSEIQSVRARFTREDGAYDGELLELSATIHFLLNQTFRYVPNEDSRISRTRNWVHQNKPELAPRFDEALDNLRSLKMLT